VFLDRDGTITRDAGFTYRPEDLCLLDGAVEGLQVLGGLGRPLIVVTNQSGIARGYFTEADAARFNALLAETLAAHGVRLTAFYVCPFHPTEGVGPYRQESPCRKPAPGMLLQAAREHRIDLRDSYMIGDKASDVLAGRRAGCRTILVRTGVAGGDMAEVQPDWVAADLVQAAQLIRDEVAAPGRREA
jgi:D-glycero-D-manno-heptose 1,7-bisphosphate phosphatase